MLKTTLVEDLNCLACAAEQERYRDDPERARSALERLRYIDTSEIARFQQALRELLLERREVGMLPGELSQ